MILIVHIGLVVDLFLPSILLPFTLWTRRATFESDRGIVHSLPGPLLGHVWYLMAALVGAIGFLMSTKPSF